MYAFTQFFAVFSGSPVGEQPWRCPGQGLRVPPAEDLAPRTSVRTPSADVPGRGGNALRMHLSATTIQRRVIYRQGYTFTKDLLKMQTFSLSVIHHFR